MAVLLEGLQVRTSRSTPEGRQRKACATTWRLLREPLLAGVEAHAGDPTLVSSPSSPKLGRNVVQADDLGPALSYDEEHLRRVLNMGVFKDDPLLSPLARKLFAVTAGGAEVPPPLVNVPALPKCTLSRPEEPQPPPALKEF